ncbi:MAG: response regulator, partial [Bacteroidota bacterium]|nr:response regulator [Bacteroidota bacterium]
DSALEMCKVNKNIDLILMDIQLPEINGYDLTKKVREFNAKVPIIAQTANAMEGDKKKALDAGCNDYISKPIDVNFLVEKIGRLLDSK